MAEPYRGFGAAVYDALNISGNSTSFLSALEGALAAPADDATLDQLSAAVAKGPQAEAIANRIYPVSPVLAFYRHQREDPGWKLGTYKTRREIIDRLWNRAQAQRSNDLAKAGDDARAAVLLAAQEAFQYAPATVAFLVDQPDFDELTQWPATQLRKLRDLLANEQAVAATFVAHLNAAADATEALITLPSSTLDPTTLGTLLSTMDQMVSLGGNRPDVLWRVANFAWRIAGLARSRSDAEATNELKSRIERWSNATAFPHFRAWLNEAITAQSPPPKTTGFKRLTGAEFQKRVKQAP